MEEPNKSALVLPQQEASELLALFDQLRGEAIARDESADALSEPAARSHEPPTRVTN
ncbi:hypothetical protein M3O57_19130 [Xanthomonas nasturtii]|uniref:hypothetical protein n=1 Tax=Xanthomonas nasturtii TaxID=1843581 RepID=UPI0013BE9537|nr:hypothetical protein [Xanthomonas nasturtii]MCL1500673.1 hypothetical protein [Xanthomonas nasturtii]MCL1504422.1 hypothetical protein [Xanthomonas nasturtii]MCL1523867.1 hypothetical protein [Xanthomonas nasturtii]MCL1532499.1 hypothetical protein [Xanthomonas nasturtii]MCL1567264.1 hypothetical protein [Xanthomonas nasturtii]